MKHYDKQKRGLHHTVMVLVMFFLEQFFILTFEAKLGKILFYCNLPKAKSQKLKLNSHGYRDGNEQNKIRINANKCYSVVMPHVKLHSDE